MFACSSLNRAPNFHILGTLGGFKDKIPHIPSLTGNDSALQTSRRLQLFFLLVAHCCLKLVFVGIIRRNLKKSWNSWKATLWHESENQFDLIFPPCVTWVGRFSELNEFGWSCTLLVPYVKHRASSRGQFKPTFSLAVVWVEDQHLSVWV